MNSMITCPYCKKSFEISDAIQHQIEEELLRAKTEQSETLRKEFDIQAEAKLKQAVQSAVSETQQAAELLLARERQAAKLELEKAKQSTEFEVEKAKQSTELESDRLRQQAESAKESEKQLREQMKSLLEELSKANKAREDAEIAARKELLEKEKLIREEAASRASEDFNTKIREQEETINRLREQLTAAKQVAEQGSQQLQGEILELDIEQALRAAFPFDTIDEVKKGERGSDIRQVVNEQFYQNCGLVLWECKNAKTYQAGWLGKLKDELATEKAQIGVIVFNPTDGGGDDFKQLADNIWLVKPRYTIMLATFLRDVCVKVAVANRNAEGKDVKIEMIYNYLTGGEFSNRIRYIIESYDEMAKQLDTEKKQAQKRWAAQEKILQKVTSSLYGMSGDLQGIAGKEIIALPGLDIDGDVSYTAASKNEESPKKISISGRDEDEY
ncbi:hypothetical protein JT05_06645 [Desulfosporosinus sp. Tol-M]|nr:hypothetical protein JT05_06645 [Desulfosporosinus sp. Tol-M]